MDEEEQQKDFEDKMDQFLLGESMPMEQLVVHDDQDLLHESQSSNSDMTSNNSQMIN